MLDRSRTLQWIESVVDSSSSHCESPSDCESKPSEKRLKRSHRKGASTDFLNPYNTEEPLGVQDPKSAHHVNLRTPPETKSVSTADGQSPTQNSYSRRQQADRQRSPKKPRSNLDARDLLTLETPVRITPWRRGHVKEQEGFLKVQKLYETIATYTAGQGIIPNEVHLPYFTAIFEDDMGVPPLQSHYRTEPMHWAITDNNPLLNDPAHAAFEFAILHNLKLEAAFTHGNGGHESHWMSAVYAPLLHYAFDRIRLVNVSTATMEGDSIPMLRRPKIVPGGGTSNGLDITSKFCMTVTGSSVSSIDSHSNFTVQGTKDPRHLAHIQTRSSAKIVDYAIVLNSPYNSPLQQTIFDLLTRISDSGRRHVNQSSHQLLCDDIIAVSIEAKTNVSGVDPILQLALWTAAWHKRMKALRREVFARHITSIPQEDERWKLRMHEKQKRLITVPVITIVGHQWDMYFAFFDAEVIQMHGPVQLGSTHSLLTLYTLLACLRAIQEWVRSTFWEAMEDWFMVPGTA
ncbi:hypothetical protein GGR51DRAFT_411117 [Nemania sp. FL0031]|nr:hypothetical protein GGR51DRAFT_411117 [Nemania sp. FL0031]